MKENDKFSSEMTFFDKDCVIIVIDLSKGSLEDSFHTNVLTEIQRQSLPVIYFFNKMDTAIVDAVATEPIYQLIVDKID